MILYFLSERRGRVICAAILTALMAVLFYMTIKSNGFAAGSFGLCLLMSLLSVVLILAGRPSGKLAVLCNILEMLVIPVAAFMMLQNFTHDALRVYPQMLAVNFGFSFFFFLFVSFVCGSFSIGYTIGALVMLVIGMANYFVMSFRSSPIVPWDIYSIRTAASVASQYAYTTDWKFLTSFSAFMLMLTSGTKNTWKIRKPFIRILIAILFFAALAGEGILLQRDDVQKALSMDTILFTPVVRYRNNGFLAAFIGNIHLIQVEEPEGYSPERVEEIAAEVLEKKDAERGADPEENNAGPDQADPAVTQRMAAEVSAQTPNIIVIMNEAFSDLSVLGDFAVSEDYMPYMRQMMKEFGGGQLMVSVKGGNTANTEYEFLSGDTTAFLPEGSVAYQQFVHDNVPALPSYLASLGYTTTAIHPYLASGWNRNTVYEKLGFRTFLSRDDFVNPQALRGYISDQSAFEKIVEVIENREDNAPSFIFEVTMQNHGGYSNQSSASFQEEVHLTGLTSANTQTRAAEKYLTLIKRSDEALKALTDYFEESGEPTIIVMFGDHQPSDYITNVIARLTGYDPDRSLQEAQKSYIVPYVVWNNFGMEMKNRPLTSVNYLAADILKSCNLPLSVYQQFLLQLQEELPVVAAGAYADAGNHYYTYEDESDWLEPLNRYRILEYNHLIDTKNRVTEIFTYDN